MSPFHPNKERGFSKKTRMTRKKLSFTSVESFFSFSAYRSATSVLWIEQGPTIITCLSSCLTKIDSAVLRLDAILDKTFSLEGNFALRSLGDISGAEIYDMEFFIGLILARNDANIKILLDDDILYHYDGFQQINRLIKLI